MPLQQQGFTHAYVDFFVEPMKKLLPWEVWWWRPDRVKRIMLEHMPTASEIASVFRPGEDLVDRGIRVLNFLETLRSDEVRFRLFHWDKKPLGYWLGHLVAYVLPVLVIWGIYELVA